MSQFALLVSPSHNRVYGSQSARLTLAELAVLSERMLGSRVLGAGEREIAGVSYITFEADPLGPRDIEVVSMLSSAFALFEMVDGLLRPVELPTVLRHDDDLVTIQRYSGKTNELFTRLLLNVTCACSARADEVPGARLRVLDPLCGRGTTLNQAVVYGWDAAGLELDRKDVEAYVAFLSTWLRDKRMKHSVDRSSVNRTGRRTVRRVRFELAADKQARKAGDVQEVGIISDDTRNTAEHFRKSSFDLIVADLPYGVQHGGLASAGHFIPPLDLVRESLEGWVRVLRRGATIGLSFNVRTTEPEAVVEALRTAGLHVVIDPAQEAFRHRVDASITRDIVVASKLV